ncbi:MAG TPA: hypothetical protein VGM12_01190 [Trebonia sp.]
MQDDGGPFAVPGAERIGQHGSGERKQRDIHQEHGVQDEQQPVCVANMVEQDVMIGPHLRYQHERGDAGQV